MSMALAVAVARATARSSCQPRELEKQAVFADVRALVLFAAERVALRVSSRRPARSRFLMVLPTLNVNAMLLLHARNDNVVRLHLRVHMPQAAIRRQTEHGYTWPSRPWLALRIAGALPGKRIAVSGSQRVSLR